MIRFILILSVSCSVLAIKVPLPQDDDTEKNTDDKLSKKPIYYESDEEEVDSYLVPPNPHAQDEIPDAIATPATYLLPPLPDSKSEYYIPTEPAVQSDWYPIVQGLPKVNENIFNTQQINSEDSVPIYISERSQKSKPSKKANELKIRIPARQLLPPIEDTRGEVYVPAPATELELPEVNTKKQFIITAPLSELHLPNLEKKQEFNPLIRKVPLIFKPAEPTLALDLVPPKLVIPVKYKPTKLYPKKYSNDFKPIPIPINQFSDEDNLEVPLARPIKPFRPSSNSEEDYAPEDDKTLYLYKEADLKRQNDRERTKQEQDTNTGAEETYADDNVSEQDVSETAYRHSQPLRESSSEKKEEELNHPAPNDRTEFRMHGMKGPHSYQFGYDTGKGKNRQFRYEERDNDGHVKGHYGYVDRSGKLRVVNYDAHPEHGFHADAPQ